MGLTPFPADLIMRLAGPWHATAFVETGTFHGATAIWASKHFEVVHTIELGEHRYRVTAAALSGIANISCWRGDSRKQLPTIVRELGKRRAVFYLDGHWSGEDTDGENDQCPLLDELACLSDEDIIVIDDARIFIEGAQAFPPLDLDQWPTMQSVRASIPDGMHMQVVDDVIFAVPEELRRLL